MIDRRQWQLPTIPVRRHRTFSRKRLVILALRRVFTARSIRDPHNNVSPGPSSRPVVSLLRAIRLSIICSKRASRKPSVLRQRDLSPRGCLTITYKGSISNPPKKDSLPISDDGAAPPYGRGPDQVLTHCSLSGMCRNGQGNPAVRVAIILGNSLKRIQRRAVLRRHAFKRFGPCENRAFPSRCCGKDDFVLIEQVCGKYSQHYRRLRPLRSPASSN